MGGGGGANGKCAADLGLSWTHMSRKCIFSSCSFFNPQFTGTSQQRSQNELFLRTSRKRLEKVCVVMLPK